MKIAEEQKENMSNQPASLAGIPDEASQLMEGLERQGENFGLDLGEIRHRTYGSSLNRGMT